MMMILPWTAGSLFGFPTFCCKGLKSGSIGHPPQSSASPVELRLRVGPRTLSGNKITWGTRGEEFRPSVRNALKGNKLGVNE
jgi:hypothetical protein